MKAIIFDMDGVLINTEPLHFKCWKALMEEEGKNLTYDIYKLCIGSTREYLIQLLEESCGGRSTIEFQLMLTTIFIVFKSTKSTPG